MPSIRKRLLIIILLLIAATSSISMWRSYSDARYEIQEIFDAQLSHTAKLLQSIILSAITEQNPENIQEILSQITSPSEQLYGNFESGKYGHLYEKKISFQLWSHTGDIILHSSSAPEIPLSGQGPDNDKGGYSDNSFNNITWRVFSIWDKQGKYLLQVAEHNSIRHELTEKISRRVIHPTLILLPLLALFVWIGIGKGLRPLKGITQKVSNQDPSNLNPIDIGQVPIEIRPLIESLNKLFFRLHGAIEKERRFTADASHEIRTPLAALKTQAQVAIRSEDNDIRRQALENVISGVDRASHLVSQMLTLARFDPEKHKLQITAINFGNLVSDIVASLVPIALEKHIEIEMKAEQGITIHGDMTSLEILVKNIVQNAILYTPEHGQINIFLYIKKNNIIFEVEDTGPGIEKQFRDRIFDRFYRINGSSANGSGLGMAIVKQIADMHNATIKLEDARSENGLLVKIIFPAS